MLQNREFQIHLKSKVCFTAAFTELFSRSRLSPILLRFPCTSAAGPVWLALCFLGQNFAVWRSLWGKGTFIPLPCGKTKLWQQIYSDLHLNHWHKSKCIHVSGSGLGKRIGDSMHHCHQSWPLDRSICDPCGPPPCPLPCSPVSPLLGVELTCFGVHRSLHCQDSTALLTPTLSKVLCGMFATACTCRAQIPLALI